MPAPTIVAAPQLARRIGLPDAPVLIDVGLALCDAVHRWARDATDETYNWRTPGKTA
jgi:hypothetical protein